MPKIYPNATSAAAAAAAGGTSTSFSTVDEKVKLCPVPVPVPDPVLNNKDNSWNSSGKPVEVLTVWKKSLLFNCDGFTVFDAKGNLVFRVDNYSAAAKAEIFLMDASGNSLLTIRRKRLSLSDNWLVYKGETAVNPILSVRKHVNLLNTKSLALATTSNSNVAAAAAGSSYEIEGSYARRCCAVYECDDKRRRRRVVAEIRPKEAAVGVAASKGVSFGLDVFRLVIHPGGMDSSIAMAFLILLDQMFGTTKRFQLNLH